MAAPYGKPPAPYGYPGGPPGAYGAPPPGAPGGYPPPGQYGAPPPGAPGGYPPPGQYGAPPPGQYGAPPPGQYGAPPPGQYGAKPPAGAPPGQYGAPPPGQYGAPPPGQYGAPPPGQYGAPPGGAPYGAPPPGQYGAPPPGQYGAPPGQYGAKPPAAPYGAPPGQYGAPPPGQYGAPPGQYGAPPGQYGAPAPGHYGAPGQYGAAPGQPQAWGAKPPAGGAGGWNVAADPRKNAFMSALKQNLTRDYVILVDKSGSMQGQRWHDANVALQALAGEVCRADPDGATLVFFSTAGTLLRYGNVTSGGKVNELFSTVYPGGTTDLGGALTAVLNEHFDPSRAKPGYPPGHAPTTVLIITDGEPDDAGEVVRVLVNASNALLADAELSVTFIQVGDDEDAARFLRTLDDGLVPKGARFDIVDTITKDKMMGLSFADLIFKSLHD